jgi:hypothetical protein
LKLFGGVLLLGRDGLSAMHGGLSFPILTGKVLVAESETERE